MILPLVVAILCAIILAYGVKTGGILIKNGTAKRHKEPFVYWSAVGIWSILLGFMLFLGFGSGHI